MTSSLIRTHINGVAHIFSLVEDGKDVYIKIFKCESLKNRAVTDQTSIRHSELHS